MFRKPLMTEEQIDDLYHRLQLKATGANIHTLRNEVARITYYAIIEPNKRKLRAAKDRCYTIVQVRPPKY